MRTGKSILLTMIFLLWGSLSVGATEKQTEESGLEEGQRKARIMAVSIEGNELTYYEITDQEENTSEMTPGQRKNGARQDTVTVYLPVAVVVHTDTGEEMTFSILESGDELEVLFEEYEDKEIITEIWMESAEGEKG